METCFGLCSHPSPSFPRLLRHPLLRGALPLWLWSREESAGPAFLLASSFHVAVSPNTTFYVRVPEILFGSVLFLILPPPLYSVYFSPLLGPPSLILCCLGFSTCPPCSRDSEIILANAV